MPWERTEMETEDMGAIRRKQRSEEIEALQNHFWRMQESGRIMEAASVRVELAQKHGIWVN